MVAKKVHERGHKMHDCMWHFWILEKRMDALIEKARGRCCKCMEQPAE